MARQYVIDRNLCRAEAMRQAQLAKYVVDDSTGCWVWVGGLSDDGYGKVKRHGKTLRAHRVFYEHHLGPIPEGMVVMHSCDNPRCVNPEHLRCGTHLENELDKDRKGRRSISPSVSHPDRIPRGERHPRFGKKMLPHVMEALRRANVGKKRSTEQKERLSPLSREEVLAIKDEEGTHKSIALKYGVSRSTIARIKNGVRWTHVTSLGAQGA